MIEALSKRKINLVLDLLVYCYALLYVSFIKMTILIFDCCILVALLPFYCSDRLELRDEWRLENRRAFANIWSDTVYGISLFILLYFNKSKVSLPFFTLLNVLMHYQTFWTSFHDKWHCYFAIYYY